MSVKNRHNWTKSLYCQNLNCKQRGKQVSELFETELKTNTTIKVEIIKMCMDCKNK